MLQITVSVDDDEGRVSRQTPSRCGVAAATATAKSREKEMALLEERLMTIRSLLVNGKALGQSLLPLRELLQHGTF